MSMGMRFVPRQEMKQTQKMSPRMIQSMELLQLPILALKERIEEQLLENPALEQKDDSYDDDYEEIYGLPAENTTEKETSENEASDNSDNFSSENESNEGNSESEAAYSSDDSLSPEDYNPSDDYSSDDYWQDDAPYERASGNGEDASEQYSNMMANVAAPSESLQEHLENQLGWFDISDEQKERCQKIIYSLNDRGYFSINPETNKPFTLDELFPDLDSSRIYLAQQALQMVQQMDPAGVGARNLKECLTLQLTPERPFYNQLKNVIENYLEDLEQNKLPQICKATGYSMDLLQTLIEEFSSLTSNPGADFQNSFAAPITPDVFVIPLPEGGYEVKLEDTELPQLHVSSLYKKLEQSGKATSEEKEYIRQKIGAAQWLIDSIQQRKNTILRVCQAIVNYQQDFFDKGPQYIKPLKMQQIADVVGIHVTTVSRAVADKWALTPRGLLEVKSFFGGGAAASSNVSQTENEPQAPGSSSEEEVAYAVIRSKIKEMVDAEDKTNPLSDDTIAERLNASGLNVARRTIAKYRQILNIPSSRQRKIWK